MAVNQKINERAALVNWANETTRFLKKSVSNKGLLDSISLKNSISMEMMGIATEVKTFVFKFNQYGMYVDMGLFGKKSLEQKNDLVAKLTSPKKRNKALKNLPKKRYQWYSRTMYGSVNVLTKIMLDQYGIKGIQSIELPEIVEL